MTFEEIDILIQNGNFVKARNALIELNEADIAEFFNELPKKELVTIFRLLPKDLGAEVFSYMNNDAQLLLVQSITDKEISAIIDELFFDDTIDFLDEMPSNVVKRVLNNSSPAERKLINQFLSYPENSAGSLMTIEYVSLKKKQTAKDALAAIRKNGLDKETINLCFVTSATRQLEGVVSIRNIILAEPDATIESIMETNIISVTTFSDQEEVALMFKKYDLSVIPVVDKTNRLVGIITIDDILDVIEQEATEDIQIMAGLDPIDQEYMKTGVFNLSFHRLTWLLILMVSSTISAAIMRGYESVLATSAILASFIPMLMDTGGNAGAQAATLIIRGLAVGEIKIKDFWKIIVKEFAVGVITGVTLTIINFLKIVLFDNMVLHANISMDVAFVVSISILITVILAKVVGGVLPIFARSCKLDPAIMASPLITTIVDAVSLIIYFTMAVNMLNLI